MEMATQNPIQHFSADQLNHVQNQLSGKHLPWLTERRQHALNQFIETGYPGRKHEEWRYTQTRDIEKHDFKPVMSATLVDTDVILKHQIPNTLTLVFVDGFFQPDLSSMDTSALPVTVTNLANALDKFPDLVETHLDSINQNHHGFCYLNSALFNDGLFIHIPEFITLDMPIHIINVGSASDAMVSNRNLVIAEQDSSCHIIESWISNDKLRLTNSITEIIMADNARIEIDSIQEQGQHSYHISTTWSQLANSAQLTHHSFNFGGQLVRNDINTLLGNNTECSHSGLTVTKHKQHIDNHLRIEHLLPDASSKVLYKNIADDHSQAVFQGCIVVHQDAQQTDSDMSNPNLLLSDDAIINTKPQLQIDADDVQCTHGVTVGELEQSALFFLRSRGLDELTARNILTFAFANETIQDITSTELKTMILDKLLTHFPQSAIRMDWL